MKNTRVQQRDARRAFHGYLAQTHAFDVIGNLSVAILAGIYAAATSRAGAPGASTNDRVVRRILTLTGAHRLTFLFFCLTTSFNLFFYTCNTCNVLIHTTFIRRSFDIHQRLLPEWRRSPGGAPQTTSATRPTRPTRILAGRVCRACCRECRHQEGKELGERSNTGCRRDRCRRWKMCGTPAGRSIIVKSS